jgi:hypothetical protein
MAGSIGKMTASLASVQNENTLALANLNFDFSLVKLEAPVNILVWGRLFRRKGKWMPKREACIKLPGDLQPFLGAFFLRLSICFELMASGFQRYLRCQLSTPEKIVIERVSSPAMSG